MKKIILVIAAALTACAPKWAPAGDRIRTPWADEIVPSKVHSEYPRPQMVRGEWQSLNGLWDYAIVPKDAPCPEKPDGKILVPFCAESSLSGVGRHVTADDALWYRRTFNVPRGWKDRVLLHFDAVDWSAEVWVNGIPFGIHTGGYTAFEYDISDILKKGSQELVVKVLDSTDNGEQPRGKQVSNPGGIWYTPVTGIWQSVWLESAPLTYVCDYNVVSSVDDGTLDVSVLVDGEADKVVARLFEGADGYSTLDDVPGAEVASAEFIPWEDGILKVDKPMLWSPEHPYLYALDIEVYKDDKLTDRVHAYTAFRKSSEVRDSEGNRRIGLNNEPCFQFGPLDQGWWPDGLYTAPSDEALKFDIAKTKDFGYNMIRKHIKVEPSRWYWYCDRLGICVWQDMPSLAGNLPGQWGEWGYDTGYDYPLSESAKTTYYKEWGEIILQLRKFPCIVVWVPFNEAWSQFDTPDVVEATHELDPTRLINSASGGNSHHCGDILDSHNYPNPHMKFRSGGSQIDVLGEYGGIGRAIEGHMWKADGGWGYSGLMETEADAMARYAAFADEFISEIATGVSAGVYTQTTDVEVELNGLMTYDRKIIKYPEEELRAVNQMIINSAKK